jgi:VanZ family protein
MMLQPFAGGESLAHFGVFFLLALTGALCLPPTDRGRFYLYATAFAVCTELLQVYYFSRGLQFADLVMNLAGLWAGIALIRVAVLTGRSVRGWVRA